MLLSEMLVQEVTKDCASFGVLIDAICLIIVLNMIQM